jgi:hypothetical protein
MDWFTDITVGGICGFLLTALVLAFMPFDSPAVGWIAIAGAVAGIWYMRYQRR